MPLDKPKSKTYCPILFDTIYSSNKDDCYQYCCYARHNKVSRKYKQSTHTPFEFFLSDEMNEVRRRALTGEKIDGCSRCYDEEERIDYSSRIRYINQYTDRGYYPKEVGRIEFKLRHFGNHCNLSCVMCNPWNSTTRAKELKETDTEKYITEGYGDFYYENLNYKTYQNFVKSILDNIQYIDRFLITGGEPLQMPKLWQFLVDDIPDEHAKNIKIIFDTNLTKLTFKDKYIFNDIAKKYKVVSLNVSCDNVGNKLGFMRYPIDVDEFENNLFSYHRYIQNIQISVSTMNILDLDKIYDYYIKNFNLKVVSLSYVQGPMILSVRNFKDEVKKELEKKYSHFDDKNKMFMNEFSKSPWPNAKEKTINYLNSLGKSRNIDWTKMWGKEWLDKLA